MKVIKMFANWCGPCRRYTPTFDEFKEQNSDIEFIEQNVDSGWDNDYNINQIPATIFIKDSKYEVLMGAVTLEKLNETRDKMNEI